MKKIALQVETCDNVATIFADGVVAGSKITVRNKQGTEYELAVIGDVPYGHKIAVVDIKKGENIVKYGETIGIASKDISRGEYVHIHNIDALRGRGDL